jgi:hypothetical protein
MQQQLVRWSTCRNAVNALHHAQHAEASAATYIHNLTESIDGTAGMQQQQPQRTRWRTSSMATSAKCGTSTAAGVAHCLPARMRTIECDALQHGNCRTQAVAGASIPYCTRILCSAAAAVYNCCFSISSCRMPGSLAFLHCCCNYPASSSTTGLPGCQLLHASFAAALKQH